MARAGGARRQADVWHSLFRIGVGVFWLYFAVQKWPAPIGFGATQGIGWMRPMMEQSAKANPIPPKLAATFSSASQVARLAGNMREMNQATGEPTTSEMVAQTTPSSIDVMIARWSLRLE